MMFPILTIAFVLVQISSPTQSEATTEELGQTNPIVSTSAYPALNSESEAEEASLEYSATNLASKLLDSSQDGYDTTTSSNLLSPAVAKITWNPVSSIVFSTVVPMKSPDYENTFPSSSSQNTTQFSETNAFNNQTPPSIFENLDHEENELDSDTRVTDTSKSLKTTLNTDPPPQYTHKFEPVSTESAVDDPLLSLSSVHHLVSISEDEPISIRTTKLDTSFEHNVNNSTGMPLSPVPDYTVVESSTSASVAEFSNLDVFDEIKETSSVSTRAETIMTDANLFSFTKDTSENLHKMETENTKNATSITETMKVSYDENLKSTTSLNAEDREEESNLNDSSLVPNSTYTESPKDLEQLKTLSSSEKNEQELNREITPPSSFSDQSELNSEVPISTTGVMNTDSLTSEKFPSTISDTSAVDISSNTFTPFTASTLYDESLLQNASDHNSVQEDYLSTITEASDSHSSSTIPTKSSDQEILSVSTPTGHKLSTGSDGHVTTTTTETEEYTESTIAKASVSEMDKTILISAHSTEGHHTSLHDEISEAVSSSLERNRTSKYDISTVSNTEKEDAVLSTSVILPDHSDTPSPTYSSVNVFEIASKLLTTTNPSSMTGQYLPSTKMYVTRVNDIDESNTVTDIPSNKHIDTENLTDSFSEQSTVSQTIPYQSSPSTKTQLTTAFFTSTEESESVSATFTSTYKDTDKETTTEVFTEKSIFPQTDSYLMSSTTLEQSPSSVTHNEFSTFKPVNDFSTEETTKLESYTTTDKSATSLPDSYSTDSSSTIPETHREGKHIPFSTASTIRVTDLSSEYGYLLVTTERTPVMKAPVNDTEVHYVQIQMEDINLVDRTDMITAIIQFPVDSLYQTDMKVKLARTHQWLDNVLNKEFRNWTRDPFEEAEEHANETPFGNISIFYVKPTPETNVSHITLTFIVYNAWRNRTLPVHFVLGTLNFYSKELKESINASAVYFYHGLSTENYDLLSAVFDKYGIIIFTICLAVVGITILVCVVIFYRKKTRQSIHYLADSKLQQNLQEAVGIDLTPASIILQDEKEEKGSKICDDEGWLVPIADVPVAEDNNAPNVQDTKL